MNPTNTSICVASAALAATNLYSTGSLCNHMKDWKNIINPNKSAIANAIDVPAKLSTMICFFVSLSFSDSLMNSRKMTRYLGPSTVVVPILTHYLAEIAKKAGKYEKPCAKLDEYCDKAFEAAFSVMSVACCILYAKQINRSVSAGNLAITVVALAAAVTSTAYKILRLVQSYQAQAPITVQPITIDINTLALDLTETREITIPDENGNPKQVTITLGQAATEVINRINQNIKPSSKEVKFPAEDALFSQYHAFRDSPNSPSWLAKISLALCDKKQLRSYLFPRTEFLFTLA